MARHDRPRMAMVCPTTPTQRISFKPSCNCRELPRSPRVVRVARICPNADDARLFTGWPKFGWLNRLNASRLPLLSVTAMIGLKGLPHCRLTIGDMVQPSTSRLAKAPLALNRSEEHTSELQSP